MRLSLRTTISIPKFNALLLILLSFFYLYGNETIALIIISVPLVVEVVLILAGRHSLLRRNSIILSLIIILYTLLTQLLVIQNLECLSFMFSVVYFVLSFTSITYRSKEEILRYLNWLLIFAMILLIMDTFYRFTHPLNADYYVGVHTYLKYKGPGILFVDTNNTGMLSLALHCLLVYLDNVHDIKYRKLRLLNLILLALTFSRAAILAYILLIMFVNEKIPKYLKLMTSFLALIAIYIYIPRTITDVSVSLKLDMVIRMLEYWKEASIFEVLFGVGFTNSISVIGLFTHSWPLTFSFEFGLVGFCLILLLWWFLYKESNRKALFVLLPCLFAGISYLPLLMPYMYTFIAIIIVLEKGGIKKC